MYALTNDMEEFRSQRKVHKLYAVEIMQRTTRHEDLVAARREDFFLEIVYMLLCFFALAPEMFNVQYVYVRVLNDEFAGCLQRHLWVGSGQMAA